MSLCHLTVSLFSIGVMLEGKNQFLTPTEKIKTVKTRSSS